MLVNHKPQRNGKTVTQLKKLVVKNMNVIFDFNSNWYVLLFGFLAAWAILFVVRRKWIVQNKK